MPKVAIDPGHGGRDTGARTANGRNEQETNLRVALKVEALLKGQGVEVLMTRTADKFLSVAERCNKANAWGADIFVSLHADAASDPGPHGHHAIYSIHARPGQGGARLARLLVDEVERATGRTAWPRGDRGIWTRESEATPGKDYYGILRGTTMPAIILERGFMTNPDDLQLLFDDEHLNRQATGIAAGIYAYFGIGLSQPTPGGTPILSKGRVWATMEQAQAWARGRGAHQRFVEDMIPALWEAALRIGIRPEVMVAQSAKETAFGRFGGVLTPDYHNTAGIKTRTGGANEDPNAHERFPSWAEGARVHANQLAAYVGIEPIGEPHGRYYVVKSLSWAGTIRTVEDLGGRWAPNPDYGRSIVRDYLAGLLADGRSLATAEPPPPQVDVVARLRAEKEALQAQVADLRRRLEAIKELVV